MKKSFFYLQVFFKGRVQGVGFRQTTLKLAKKRALKGFVTNISDGSVKVLFRASLRDVYPLIEELDLIFGNKIEIIELSYKENSIDLYKDFKIIH